MTRVVRVHGYYIPSERAGGGGGCSDDVGGNVVVLGGQRPTTLGEQAADGATTWRGGRRQWQATRAGVR